MIVGDGSLHVLDPRWAVVEVDRRHVDPDAIHVAASREAVTPEPIGGAQEASLLDPGDGRERGKKGPVAAGPDLHDGDDRAQARDDVDLEVP